jgi:GT2 family glycosyltransferase
MAKVGVIISMLNFNDLTDKCVESVLAQVDVDCDIVVVDDGSKVSYAHEGVQIIRYEEPHGNTHSINAGIKFFDNKYKYIMNLDNDIELEPNAIKELVTVMESQPSVAIAGSLRITNRNGKEIRFGHSIDLRGSCITLKSSCIAYLCFWVSGCSVLMRSSVIQEIGMFDKRFENYCQDAEWCLRALINDYSVAMVPRSIAHHVGEITMTTNLINNLKDKEMFNKILSSKVLGDILAHLPIDFTTGLCGRLAYDTFNKPAPTELT